MYRMRDTPKRLRQISNSPPRCAGRRRRWPSPSWFLNGFLGSPLMLRRARVVAAKTRETQAMLSRIPSPGDVAARLPSPATSASQTATSRRPSARAAPRPRETNLLSTPSSPTPSGALGRGWADAREGDWAEIKHSGSRLPATARRQTTVPQADGLARRARVGGSDPHEAPPFVGPGRDRSTRSVELRDSGSPVAFLSPEYALLSCWAMPVRDFRYQWNRGGDVRSMSGAREVESCATCGPGSRL